MATQTKVAKKADTISAKKIGANFVAKIDGKNYSKKLSKEDAEKVENKIKLYNKKPSDATKNAIIKLLSPETVKAAKKKEDLVTKSKGLKKLAKKTVKKAKVVEVERRSLLDELETLLTEDETAIPKLEALIAKFKKVEEKQPVAVTSEPIRQSRREY